MQRQKRFMAIFKDKSGASLIFVLGIMLLLLAIGASALAAASANTGFVLQQNEHNQILILDDAIHKNIMYSLQHDTKSDSLLSRQLVEAIYNARDLKPKSLLPPSHELFESEGISLDIDFDKAGLEAGNGKFEVKSITLSFPKTLDEMVQITSPIPAVYIPSENIDIVDDLDFITGTIPKGEYGITVREPKTATVNATMIVTVELAVKEGINGTNDKIVTSRAIYEYTGGFLSDDPNGDNSQDDTPGAEYAMELVPDSFGKCGEWRLIKHERVDQ